VNWEKIIFAALLAAFFAMLIGMLYGMWAVWKKLNSVDERLRERNASIAKALTEHNRRHVRAVLDGGSSRSDPTVARINW
jgi:F0F1-type ATP synthase membrane subunit b/b'